MALPDDMPPWAVGSYPAGGNSWNNRPRRVATGFTGFASAGLTPNLRTDAESFNEWHGRMQEWISWLRDESGAGLYGDGSDGSHTVVGTETLTADTYYTDLTVDAATELQCDGFRLFVSGTLTIVATGILSSDGGAGGNASPGVAGVAGTGAPGSVLVAGSAGAAGVISAAGTAGTAATDALGGAGGAGGDADGVNVGGAGGAAVAPSVNLGGYRHLNAAFGRATGSVASRWAPAGGGGSGGALGGDAASGGGGGGAGLMSIFARVLDNDGLIRTLGGPGGDAALGIGTAAGGGGGGGGGWLWAVYRTLFGSGVGTITSTGGAAGASVGTAAAAAAGATGGSLVMFG